MAFQGYVCLFLFTVFFFFACGRAVGIFVVLFCVWGVVSLRARGSGREESMSEDCAFK